MKLKNKKILFIIITVILILTIVFLVGKSFGFFTYIKEGEETNIVTIKGITTEIINKDNNALNLENSYPINDEEGLELTPFEFSMTNTSSRSLTYNIKVEIDEEKMENCFLEDNTLCPTLSADYIKYVYKKNDGSYTEPKILSESNNIIASGIINKDDVISSSIILWIDSTASNEIMNHYFYGKIVITGEEAISKNSKDTILSYSIVDKVLTLTTSSNNTDDPAVLYVSYDTNKNENDEYPPTYYFRGM